MVWSHNWNLWLLVISTFVFGTGSVFESLIYTYLPVPMAELYNQTFQNHYGISLGPVGASSITSLMVFAQKFGQLLSILFIIPLMDSRGRTFVVIHVRSMLSIACAILQFLSWQLHSAELMLLSIFLVGLAFPIHMSATGLFISECTRKEHRGAVLMFVMTSSTLAFVAMFNLSRPSVFGNSYWGFIPLIALFLSSLLYLTTARVAESPFWLKSKGKLAKAMEAVRYYQGEEEEKTLLLEDVDDFVNCDIVKYSEIWKDDDTRKLTLMFLLYACLVSLPFCVDIPYAVQIQTKLGLSLDQVMNLGTVSNVVSVPLLFIGIYFIDRFPRITIMKTALTLIYSKTVLSFFGLLLATVNGPSIYTQIIAISGEMVSRLTESCGALSLDTMLLCELLSPSTRITVNQIVMFVLLFITTPVSTPFPICFELSAPSMHFLFLITQPFMIVYVYRQMMRVQRQQYRKANLSSSFTSYGTTEKELLI